MVLLAMEPGRVDVLATELRRVRTNTDEIGLLLDLAGSLSELPIDSVTTVHEIGGSCEALGQELLERADVMLTEIETDATEITIKKGDTLTAFARQYGTTVEAIVAANDDITDPDKIRAGDTIIIPGRADAGSGPAPGEGEVVPDPPNGSGGVAGDPELGLSVEDFRVVAAELGVELAAIQAVAEVEAAGDGFLPSGRPKILFEGAQFQRITGGVFSASHPHLSHPYSESRRHYVGGEGEHDRLDEAKTLDSNAALQSASWGRFQIMGFNYAAAGYDSVEAYVDAMSLSEANHLNAFASFIEANPSIHTALQNLNWEAFARGYNGPDHASNNYAGKMAAAYDKYKAQEGSN